MLTHPKPEGAHHLNNSKYRSDIDGLRGIAVLAVVFYHAAPNDIKGGFVGVDIFFVISGFLISSIILFGLNNEKFNFIEFYSRRINRIFPALLLVLTTCYAFGWFSLFDYEYAQLGKHIAGGAGFISNFLLLSETGYFDNAVETKPLLHLWSLGVEEQFYILWPLLLWFTWRKRVNALTTRFFVAGCSFALNIALIHEHRSHVFFSPQTRFWELLVGAALACITLNPPKLWLKTKDQLDKLFKLQFSSINYEANWRVLRNAQSIVGLLFITVSIFSIEKDYSFPGWWAVFPVAGAVMLIAAGEQAWVNRKLLSSRLLVWVGLISYPLYLWHWPLLSFARIIEGQTPSTGIILVAVFVSFFLARLTYRFVEVPMRLGNHRTTKAMVLAVLMASIGLVGYVTYKMKGLEFRVVAKPDAVNSGEVGHDAYYSHLKNNLFSCKEFNAAECYQSIKNEPVETVLVGDSHALHLLVGFAEELKFTNVAFYGKSIAISDNGFDSIFDQIIASDKTTTVIVNYWWFLRKSELPSGSDLSKDIELRVQKLLAANKRVFLTNDIPSFEFDPEKCQISRKFSFSSYKCDEGISIFMDKYNTYHQALDAIARKYPGVKIIDTVRYFCDEIVCRMNKNDRLLYRDRHHLNLNGSRYTAKRILDDYPELN